MTRVNADESPATCRAPTDARTKPTKRNGSQWFFHIEPSPEERERFLEQLGVYLAAMYPGCPPRWRKQLVEQARKRGHYGRLGEIAGVLAANSIRHRGTDYERLLGINGGREGLTRDEARQVVREDVADMLAEWQQGSAEADEGYIAVRRAFRKGWQKRGRKKPRPVLTARENEAVAEYLKTWLARPVEAPQAVEAPTPASLEVPTTAREPAPEWHFPTDEPEEPEGAEWWREGARIFCRRNLSAHLNKRKRATPPMGCLRFHRAALKAAHEGSSPGVLWARVMDLSKREDATRGPYGSCIGSEGSYLESAEGGDADDHHHQPAPQSSSMGASACRMRPASPSSSSSPAASASHVVTASVSSMISS